MNSKAEGFTIRSVGELGAEALNKPWLANPMAFAVVATNEPLIVSWAFGPKIIPDGLIRNRLALPKTPSLPKISERLLPVTRLIIFSMPFGFLKMG